MRKMSKAAKAEGYDKLSTERDLLAVFAWHTVNHHVPDATEVVLDGESTYLFQLYGSMRANGGILAVTFQHPGQANSVDVYNFDDWLRVVAKMPFGIGINTDVKIAAERLSVKRHNIFEKEKETAA